MSYIFNELKMMVDWRFKNYLRWKCI